MENENLKPSLTNQCKICVKITCKRCYWEATDEEVFLIQRGILVACPLCGWKPGETSNYKL